MRTPSCTSRLSGSRIVVYDQDPIIKAGIEAVLSDAGAIIEQSLGDELDAAILDVELGEESFAPVATVLELCGVPFLFCSAHGAEVTGPRLRALAGLHRPPQTYGVRGLD